MSNNKDHIVGQLTTVTQEYVDGKDEQLWDYDGGWNLGYGTPGIIRNKNGLVADIDISSGRVISFPHLNEWIRFCIFLAAMA